MPKIEIAGPEGREPFEDVNAALDRFRALIIARAPCAFFLDGACARRANGSPERVDTAALGKLGALLGSAS